MSDSTEPRPDTTPDQLDLAPRDHGQVLNLDAFRQQPEPVSRQHAPKYRHVAATQITDRETRLKHALNLAFADLGGAAFALAHHGALNDNRLASHVKRIHALYTQLDALPRTTPGSPPAHRALGEHAVTA